MNDDRYTSRYPGRNAIVIIALLGFASFIADLVAGVPT